jgi:hypothetical protein
MMSLQPFVKMSATLYAVGYLTHCGGLLAWYSHTMVHLTRPTQAIVNHFPTADCLTRGSLLVCLSSFFNKGAQHFMVKRKETNKVLLMIITFGIPFIEHYAEPKLK